MSEISLEKIDVAGLKISPITKLELLQQITARIKLREKTFVITPYSEFLYTSFHQPEFRTVFNSADFAIADGVGILWADLFLSVPITVKNFYLSILQAWWQIVWTGAAILLRPSLLYRHIPEKIVGANLIWDLAGLAAKNNYSVYLLGAKNDEAKITAQKLQAKFPNLKIVGTSKKNMEDTESIFADLAAVQPDMLLIAWPAQLAEQWVYENLTKLQTYFVIPLGGTFDYIAGTKKQPPQFVRSIGLEWLYRLITQPTRIRRIFRATWGIILSLVRYKVYTVRPFRPDAVVVVLNTEGKILLCKRKVGPAKNGQNTNIILDNYWQFPQDGIHKKETAEQAAHRELKEETGITSISLIAVARYSYSYSWNNATRKLFRLKNYKYKGQEQITVFFKFTGPESEIKLDQRELIEYKWLTPEQVIQQTAFVRQEHAQAVLAELTELLKRNQ